MFSTTLSQAKLHVLSYLNDLATGNLKGNVRKYYNDYLSYRKNLISKFINRNIDTNTLQRRINTIIEVNKQAALSNLKKYLADKNYTGTENINEIYRFIKKAVTNKPKKNFISHKMESKNTPIQSLHELVELHNKLVGENNSDEDWVAAFGDEEKAKEEVYTEIKEDIKKHGYDGPEDYTAMYWFSKGIISTPTEQHKNKEIDAALEKIMSDERPRKKEADSDTIPDTIPSTNTDTIIDTIPAEEYPSESSNVDSAMEQLWRNPTNWYINFEQFNNEGKKALFPELKKFFDEEIGKLSIINMYKIQYKVNTEWL